jgi:SpoVK/Ycf46/Vps4 family AAA+-type ATPase
MSDGTVGTYRMTPGFNLETATINVEDKTKQNVINAITTYQDACYVIRNSVPEDDIVYQHYINKTCSNTDVITNARSLILPGAESTEDQIKSALENIKKSVETLQHMYRALHNVPSLDGTFDLDYRLSEFDIKKATIDTETGTIDNLKNAIATYINVCRTVSDTSVSVSINKKDLCNESIVNAASKLIRENTEDAESIKAILKSLDTELSQIKSVYETVTIFKRVNAETPRLQPPSGIRTPVSGNESNRASIPASDPASVSATPTASVPATPTANEVSIPISSPSDDAITSRFFLYALLRIHHKHKENVRSLIQNGLYYLTVNNACAALSAFSAAASYVYALQSADEANKTALQPTMSAILGYVETLQEKTKNLGVSGQPKKEEKEDEKDKDEDIDIECEVFGCEKQEGDLCLTFKDVVGMGKEKQVFFDAITQPLIYPNLYTKGAKGILLYGPPGTGKTFLVKAAIRELAIRYANAKVLFFPLTGADLKGKYVGETEQKIVRAYNCASRRACQMTDLYNRMGPKKCRKDETMIKDRLKALQDAKLLNENEANMVLNFEDEAATEKLKKQYKANGQFVSVLFIDEFDSIGGDRSKDDTGMVANAVNTFLQMIDGTESKENVITICATNFPWNLDAALIRRFSEQVYCNVPGFEDVKRLLVKEQEDRLKIKKRNLTDYCGGGKVKKIFKASDAIMKLVKQESDGEKKSCDSEKPKTSVLDIIDTSYMKDTSSEMVALVSEMVEKNYSNSDIANVMQKAFNLASQSALRSALWMKYNYPADGTNYYISKITKLAKSNTDSKFTIFDNAFDELQKSANTHTDYGKLYSDSESTWNVDIAGSNVVYGDKDSVKSIFPDERTLDEEEKNPEYQATNIWLKGKQYTNIRYIKDLPTQLMFNDNSVGDIFFNLKDISDLNAKIRTQKDAVNVSGRTSAIEELKKQMINVVFTKAMKVDYKKPMEYDGVHLLVNEFKKQCDEYKRMYYDSESELSPAQQEDFRTTISQLMFILKDFSTTLDMYGGGMAFQKHFNKDGPILTGTNAIPPAQRVIENGNIINNLFITMFNSVFHNGIGQDISNDRKKGFLTEKLSDLIANAAGAAAAVSTTAAAPAAAAAAAKKQAPAKTTIKDCKLLFESHNLVSFLDPSTYSLIKNILAKSEKDTPDTKIIDDYTHNEIIKDLNNLDLNDFRNDKTYISSDNIKYKVFYFKSKIRPFHSSWVYCKSGGLLSHAGNKVRDWVVSTYDSTIKKYFRNSDALDKEEVVESIVSRMESTKTSALRYLLLRVTGIGICDGVDDRDAYRGVYQERLHPVGKPAQVVAAAVPEQPAVVAVADAADAAAEAAAVAAPVAATATAAKPSIYNLQAQGRQMRLGSPESAPGAAAAEQAAVVALPPSPSVPVQPAVVALPLSPSVPVQPAVVALPLSPSVPVQPAVVVQGDAAALPPSPSVPGHGQPAAAAIPSDQPKSNPLFKPQVHSAAAAGTPKSPGQTTSKPRAAAEGTHTYYGQTLGEYLRASDGQHSSTHTHYAQPAYQVPNPLARGSPKPSHKPSAQGSSGTGYFVGTNPLQGRGGGSRKTKTYKNTTNKSVAKTLKNRKMESYVQYGGETKDYYKITWYNISHTGETTNLRQLLVNEDGIKSILKYDSSGQETKWNKYLIKNALAFAVLGAVTGVVAGATILTAGTATLPVTATLIKFGLFGFGAGLVTGGTYSAVSDKVNTLTNGKSDLFGERLRGVIFNDLVGLISSVENPEDDVHIVPLMIASIFTQDEYKIIKKKDESIDAWNQELLKSFYANFNIALDMRKQYFRQAEVIPSLTHVKVSSVEKVDPSNPSVLLDDHRVNLKKIIYSKENVDKDKFLNFYMDASFISAGLKAYPTTYNSVTGKMLHDYNRNRIKFLEDYQSGKYDKKKN